MALTEQEVEAAIAKGGFDPTQAQQIRLLMDRKRMQERVAKEIENETAFGFARRNLGAFGSAAAESATFGASSALTGALAARGDPRQNLSSKEAFQLAQARRDAELGASGTARTLGTLAGVAPTLMTGPAGFGLKALGAARAGSAVSRAGALASSLVPGARVGTLGFKALGGEKLALSARQALDAGNRIGSGMRQIAGALAGGTGAQVAYQAGQGAVDLATEAAGGEARGSVSDHINSILSLENAALNVGLGVAGAGLSQLAQARISPEFRAEMTRLRRFFPNFPVTHSQMRGPDSVLGRLEEASKYTAYGRGRMGKFVEEGYFKPLNDWVSGIEQRFSASPGRRFEGAAGGVRRLVGSTERPGSLLREQDAIGNQAFANALERPVPDDLLRPIAVGIAKQFDLARRVGRPLGGRVASEINRFVKQVRSTKATRTPGLQVAGDQRFAFNFNLKTLDEGRKAFDKIIEFDRYPHLARQVNNAPTGADIRVARVMRRLFRNAERQMGDDVDQALNGISQLKRVQFELKPFTRMLLQDADAETLILGALRGTDYRRSISALTKRMTPGEYGDLTGSFLARALNKIYDVTNRSVSSGKRVSALFDGGLGKEFHHSRWDAVFGKQTAQALRSEIEDIAFSSDVFRKYAGKAEGSPTYGRGVDAYAINQTMDATQSLIEAISTGNPDKWAQLRRIMWKGAGWLALISGVLDGKIARTIKNEQFITQPRFPGRALGALGAKEALLDPTMGQP